MWIKYKFRTIIKFKNYNQKNKVGYIWRMINKYNILKREML